MMRKYIYAALMAASTFILIQACKKSSDPKVDNSSSFDRKGMLANISTNIILPAYTAFQTDAVNLDAAVSAFNANPDNAGLVALQQAFQAAYKQWESTSVFEFGPAETENLRVNVNTWPANVALINSNINSGTYNSDLLANLPAKGFPALDYLLFGTGADNAAILLQYTTDAQASNRKTYLAALAAEIKTKATAVLNGWNNSYKDTFVNNTGTDKGSSTGQLVNQLIYDYEILKNYEIGVPAGTQSMGAILPEKVQGLYSKMSVQLALLHIRAVQNIYLGKSTAGDGLGFDDYLAQVDAKYNGSDLLNDVIKNQFTTGITKLQGLTDPLSDQITANQAAVTATYTELQKLTVLLKTDMTSSLGILITFGDNDGD